MLRTVCPMRPTIIHRMRHRPMNWQLRNFYSSAIQPQHPNFTTALQRIFPKENDQWIKQINISVRNRDDLFVQTVEILILEKTTNNFGFCLIGLIFWTSIQVGLAYDRSRRSQSRILVRDINYITGRIMQGFFSVQFYTKVQF